MTPAESQKKTRMILTQSIYLDSSVLFREAFGEMYMFLPSKVSPSFRSHH